MRSAAVLGLALQFATGVSLVEVYVTVTDRSGEAVIELPREAFSVFEDGELQEISTFASSDFPLSVALGLDNSFSIGYTPRQRLDNQQPRWRSIVVKVNRPDVKVRARDGYVAGRS